MSTIGVLDTLVKLITDVMAKLAQLLLEMVLPEIVLFELIPNVEIIKFAVPVPLMVLLLTTLLLIFNTALLLPML